MACTLWACMCHNALSTACIWKPRSHTHDWLKAPAARIGLPCQEQHYSIWVPFPKTKKDCLVHIGRHECQRHGNVSPLLWQSWNIISLAVSPWYLEQIQSELDLELLEHFMSKLDQALAHPCTLLYRWGPKAAPFTAENSSNNIQL